MSFTPATHDITQEELEALQAAKKIKEFLGLKSFNIVKGGPSHSDPMGLADWYFGAHDGDNYLHFGITADGKIFMIGATLAGKKYSLPDTIKL